MISSSIVRDIIINNGDIRDFIPIDSENILAMNRLITSLFFIFFLVKIALSTNVSIYAPAYKNQSIIWKKKIDYITNVSEIIAHETIDSNGYA